MPSFEDHSVFHRIDTTERFRTWARMIHKAIVEVGLVQTSDTGQVNLETVEVPAANSTYAGYEVFRFNDTLQATQPIFLKVEYGRGAGEGRPALRVTYGRGSSGAGTLTTADTAVVHASPSAPETEANKGFIYASFYNGAFTLYSGIGNGYVSPILLGCERLKDLSGAAIDAFAMLTSSLDPRRRIYRQATGVYAAGEVACAAAGKAEKGKLLPAQLYFIAPIATAPLIGVNGMQAPAMGDTIGDEYQYEHSREELDLEIGGQLITYMRMPMHDNVTFQRWNTANGGVNHKILIPRMA